MNARLRIALVSDETIGNCMAAGGIRALNIANALKRSGHEVAIFADFKNLTRTDSEEYREGERFANGNRSSDPSASASFEGFPVFAPERFVDVRSQYDLAIAGTLTRRGLPGLLRFGKPIIHDLICPFMLENRHLYAALPRFKRAAWESEMARDFVALALRACVWFVASERQRDFWSGILTASRVWLTGFSDPPPVFEIPNGVDEPDEIPHAELSCEIRTLIAKLDETPGIQRIIVHGGMHSWIAYEPLVQTFSNLTRRRMDVRLYLTGSKLPFGDEKPTSAASKFLSAASDAGIKEFIDRLPWLPYRERFEVLRRMNLGINLHPQGLETAISYRNRLLDFAAAEVPLLTSTGDVVSERMIEAGIALPIIGLDPKNIAPLIARALDARWGGNYHLACASFRSEWRWTKVLEPLERALKCALQAKSPFETYGSTPGGFFETAYCAIRSVLKKNLIR